MTRLIVRSSASGGGGAPAWFTAMTAKQWTQISANVMNDVKDPLQDTTNAGSTGGAQQRAYCGLGVDQFGKKAFFPGCGGHQDYYGNEIFDFDFTQASPAYRRLRDADAKEFTSGAALKWSTGNPIADHVGNLCVADATGRWFRFGHGGTLDGGPAPTQWWEITHSGSTAAWSDLGNSHAGGDGGTTSNSNVYWSSADRFILIHSGGGTPALEFVRPSDQAVTETNNNSTGLGGGLEPAMDDTNGVLLIKDDGSDTSYWCYGVGASRTAAPVNIIATGATPPHTMCPVWHAPSGAFFFWDLGDLSASSKNLIKLTPTFSAGNYTALVATSVTSTTGTQPTLDTAGAANRLYTRWNMINDMGNGESLMFASQWTTGVHGLRIPNSALS